MFNAYAAHSPNGILTPFTYEPEPMAADSAEITVEYCGLCHSDLSMLDNEWRITQYPFVPGHEIVGTISALGSSVSALSIGQRVGLGWHASYCLSCHECHNQDHNLCTQAQGTIVSRHGGFADKVRVQSSSVVPLPESLDPQATAPLFCGGITVFNPLLQYNIPHDAKVAVVGLGGLGHLAVQFLRAWGCEVTVLTSSRDKTTQAQALGAHYVMDSNDKSQLTAATSTFDVIFSTVNVSLHWPSFLMMLKPKGRLHFLGVVMEPLNIGVGHLMAGQKSISSSSVGSPSSIAKMLTFAQQHDIAAQIEVFPFSQVNEAIAHLREGKARFRVVLGPVSAH